ncbi:MAG: hypothetical protein HZA54_11200 [Planctomycetes bacterium]|nr:hypothetical protein [Planctomycetota bacterium]
MPRESVIGSPANKWEIREDRLRFCRQVVLTVEDKATCPLPVEERFIEAFLDRISPAGPQRLWEPRVLGASDRYGLFARVGELSAALFHADLQVVYATYNYPEGGLFQLLLEADLPGEGHFRLECPVDPTTPDGNLRAAVEKILTVPVIPLVLLDDDLRPVTVRELRQGPDAAVAAFGLWSAACLRGATNPHRYESALDRYCLQNPETKSAVLARETRPLTSPDAGTARRTKRPTTARSVGAPDPQELDRRLANLLAHYRLIEEPRLDACVAQAVAARETGTEKTLRTILADAGAVPADALDSLCLYIERFVPGTTAAAEGVALSRDDLRVATILIVQGALTPARAQKALATQWRLYRAEGRRCDLPDALLAGGDLDATGVAALRAWLSRLGPTADTRRLHNAISEALDRKGSPPPAH